MITVLYILSLLASGLMLVLIIKQFDYKVSSIYALIYLMITVCDFGYLQLLHAKTLEGALLANTITYIGGCFIPFLMLLCVCRICHFRQKNWMVVIELLCCVGAFLIVSTSGKNKLNYREVWLDTSGNYTRLMKVYGPCHNFYAIGMVIFVLLTYVVIVWNYRKKREVSYITALGLAAICSVDILAYFAESLLKTPVKLMPFAYLITEMGLFWLVSRIKKYDISAVLSDYYSKSKEYGFVLIDSKLHYMGSNEVAEKWAPCLSELHVDREIREGQSVFIKNVRTIIESGKQDEFFLPYEDRIIKHSVKFFYNRKGTARIGYYVEMVDDTERQDHLKMVEEYNEKLEREVKKKTRSLVKMQNDIILSMADTVEDRDSNTGGHIRRTSECVRIFAEGLQKDTVYAKKGEAFFESVIKAAPLHDFGKIAVDDAILRKPGKFTPEEYEIMKTHPEKGALIVVKILHSSDDKQFRKIAENVAHYHHEKWDGTGYPKGLSGEDIPLEARIMALADVFDALVSKRCYKEKYSFDKAFSIIEESLGKHFDAELGKIFIKQRTALEAYYESVQQSECEE